MNTMPSMVAIASQMENKYPSRIDRMPDDEYRRAREEYRRRDSEIRDEFAKSLAEEFLPGMSDTVSGAVFARAWEDGHASGFQEVEFIYEDIAEIVMLAVKETRG